MQAFVQSSVPGALVWTAEGMGSHIHGHIHDAECMNREPQANEAVSPSRVDAYNLRAQYRVLGSLVGAWPLQLRQNCQLGLPLLLSPEEVSLLREEGERVVTCVLFQAMCERPVLGVLDLRQYVPRSPSPDDIITHAKLKKSNADQQVTYWRVVMSFHTVMMSFLLSAGVVSGKEASPAVG